MSITTSGTPSLKDDYVSQLEARSKEWEAHVDLWRAKAHTASEDLKADFHKWQRDFSVKQEKVKERLATLRTAKLEAWEELKTGVDAVWTDVTDALEAAKKKFS